MNPLVPDFILQEDAEKKTRGTFTAAALFVDIPGFTTLTEKLVQHGREGAEILAGTLRFYFDPLVALVHEAGGFITGFAGDAFTALFPHSIKRHAADYALHVATKIQQFFAKHPEYSTRYGKFPFSFKIGLSWGEVEWGIVEVSPTERPNIKTDVMRAIWCVTSFKRGASRFPQPNQF